MFKYLLKTVKLIEMSSSLVDTLMYFRLIIVIFPFVNIYRDQKVSEINESSFSILKEVSFCQLMIRYDSYHRGPSKP